MAITHGGVGDEHPLLLRHPIGDGLGPFAQQFLAQTIFDYCLWFGRTQGRQVLRRSLPPHSFRMAVHCDVGDVGQNLGGAVTPILEHKQFGRGVNELGGAGVIEKGGMLQ